MILMVRHGLISITYMSEISLYLIINNFYYAQYLSMFSSLLNIVLRALRSIAHTVQSYTQGRISVGSSALCVACS